MFEIILDLKEKAYDQVYQMRPAELAEIPQSLIRRHAPAAEESIPAILSTDSVTVNKVKISDESSKKVLLTPHSASESPATPKLKEDRDATSHSNFASGHSEQESSRVTPEHPTHLRITDITPSNIIEDRRDSLNADNETVDADDEDENSDHSDKKSNDENKRKA